MCQVGGKESDAKLTHRTNGPDQATLACLRGGSWLRPRLGECDDRGLEGRQRGSAGV